MKTDDGQVVTLDEYRTIYPTPEDGLIECNWVLTMGCTLIKTNVFKNMREPYFLESYRDNEEGTLITEDAYFTEKAIMSGFIPYIKVSFNCGHVDRNTNTEYRKK